MKVKVFSLLIFTLLLGVLAFSVSADDDIARIYTDPAEISGVAGDTVEVEIRADDVHELGVSGGEMLINFDRQLLEVNEIDRENGLICPTDDWISAENPDHEDGLYLGFANAEKAFYDSGFLYRVELEFLQDGVQNFEVTNVDLIEGYRVQVTFQELNDLGGVEITVYEDEEYSEQVGEPVTTDVTGAAVKRLEDGNYWFRASRDRFYPEEGSFEVAGENKTVEFELERLPPPPEEELEVTFRELNQLEGVEIAVYKDEEFEEQVGESVATDETGEATKDLEDGSYWFTASKFGYHPYEGEFEIKGEAETLEFELEEEFEVYVNRLGGVNRYDTSDIIARYAYNPDDYPEGTDTVIITEGLEFADGLAGSVLSTYLDAPIVMTATEELREETESAIEFLDPNEAIILGGEAAISEDVENALEGHGLEVDRIAGVSRHDTAQLIARRIAEEESEADDEVSEEDVFDNVFIVNGAAPADSLIISPEAARSGVPILQVRAGDIPEVTEDALVDLGIENAHIIGGDAVVGSVVEDELEDLLEGELDRTWGEGRFETSAAVAEEFFLAPENVVIANGVDGLADAMSGGYFGAMKDAPVLYVREDLPIPESVSNYLKEDNGAEDNLEHIHILGGEAVVNDDVAEALNDMLEQ